MNERIQELMLEAGKTIPGDKHIDADFCKKFAELIVKECAGVAEVSMPINSYPDDRLTVKNNVLKHFGVEETKREKFRNSFEEAFKDGVDLSGRNTP
jgi:hypothetical protein